MQKPEKPVLAKPERPARPERPAKAARPRAPLEAFQVAPDPLDESLYPGDAEGDAKEELSQLEQGFRDRIAAEAGRKQSATESSYYAVIACETGEQMDALLRGLGVEPGKGDLFVDGRVIADRLGIKLPKAEVRYNPGAKADPKLSRLVR
jgi:hypothetical protein